MTPTDWQTEQPRLATRPGLPARATGTPLAAPPVLPVQVPANLLDPPSWGQRILPAAVRDGLEAFGLYQNPIPQPPSIHLAQTLAALEKYGWCKALDISPTGRMCIRGAQGMLQRAGHVTPASRARAVHYLQLSLREIGVDQPFFHWNDFPERTFPQVRQRINRAAHLAHTNGE
ncbi:DUF6197 family protein [Streptomyces chartreusis]|uniref:DUF6197 family protein n=1 Tax=Streptomyces chartreusis TaxID=1969 RepID=UPI0036569D0F